jgi:hypothetical protein
MVPGSALRPVPGTSHGLSLCPERGGGVSAGLLHFPAGNAAPPVIVAGLDRILLVAAIIAFVAGAVSLAAIRSRDFARAAPGGQEGPPAERVVPPCGHAGGQG